MNLTGKNNININCHRNSNLMQYKGKKLNSYKKIF